MMPEFLPEESDQALFPELFDEQYDSEAVVKLLDPDLHERITNAMKASEELKGHNFVTALLVAAHLGCDALENDPGVLRGCGIIAKLA